MKNDVKMGAGNPARVLTHLLVGRISYFIFNPLRNFAFQGRIF